jgi:hypothetical protein
MSSDPMIAAMSASMWQVQEADVGVDPLHDLAIKLKDEPQDAVGRRVLGPKVDGEIADSGFHRAASPVAHAT